MQNNVSGIRQVPDVDVAYQLLKQGGQPKYYKDLVIDVLTTQGKSQLADVPGGLIAGIYTQITLDSRFVHLGKGVWGLGEWYPQRGIPRLAEVPAAVKPAASVLQRDRMLLAEIQDVFSADDVNDDYEEKFDETD